MTQCAIIMVTKTMMLTDSEHSMMMASLLYAYCTIQFVDAKSAKTVYSTILVVSLHRRFSLGALRTVVSAGVGVNDICMDHEN